MKRGDHRAFPGRAFDEDGQEWIHPGMTIREYFAAKALQGLLANPGYGENATRAAKDVGTDALTLTAGAAVGFADALLAGLEEGDKT